MSTRHKIQITINANLINARQKDPAMSRIEELEREGMIKIVGTQRLHDEIKAYKHPDALKNAIRYDNIRALYRWSVENREFLHIKR